MPHRVADLGHAELGGGRHVLQLFEPFRLDVMAMPCSVPAWICGSALVT